MKFLGSLFVYAGLFVFYSATFGARSFDMGVLLFACVVGIPLLTIGSLINQAAERGKQEDADTIAERVAGDPAAHHDAFVLYLRPFETTNQFKITDAGSNLFHLEQYSRDGYDDIERVLAQSLAETLPVVALGRPGEHHGAGRVVAHENDWQTLALSLMRHANFIVLLPGSNAGTTWEMQRIAENDLLSRCLLLMPPANAYSYSAPEGVAERWLATIERWAQIGITLPQLRESGGLLRHAADGHFEIAGPLPHATPKAWRDELQRIIDSGKLQTAATKAA